MSEAKTIPVRPREVDAAAAADLAAELALCAFDLGFSWRSCLRDQALEDGRAVGRTLFRNDFKGLDMEVDQVPSFTGSDEAIVIAKAVIKKALARRARQAFGVEPSAEPERLVVSLQDIVPLASRVG